MDFVASRADEKRLGWRNRVSEVLRALGVIVFDPWFKPEVRGLHGYGREDAASAMARDKWTFAADDEGARTRAELAHQYWQTMHIDLRMVDTSDFVVAYCPTNIYSVGTPHELVTARVQHKPVLFVSPHVEVPTLDELKARLQGDAKSLELLTALEAEVPIRPNPDATPSLWYMALIGSESFFDGFGFAQYRDEFGWEKIPLDDNEARHPPARPLLPALVAANDELPQRWNLDLGKHAVDDDWMLWQISRDETGGAVDDVHGPPSGG
jgi:hypothetical protein